MEKQIGIFKHNQPYFKNQIICRFPQILNSITNKQKIFYRNYSEQKIPNTLTAHCSPRTSPSNEREKCSLQMKSSLRLVRNAIFSVDVQLQ